MSLPSIAVFSGSASGSDPRFEEAATRLGRLLAQRGTELICGGARSGLMKAVASSALSEGGRVTGVVPPTERKDMDPEAFTRVLFVDSLPERKAMMGHLAQAFLALPGGSGTLEELMEQWTIAQIGLHAKPLGVLNVGGYFDPLVGMLENMRVFGFTKPQSFAHLHVSKSDEELLRTLEARWKATRVSPS